MCIKRKKKKKTTTHAQKKKKKKPPKTKQMRQKLTTSSQTLFTKLPEGCHAAVVWLELRGPCTSRASRIPGRIRPPGEEDAPVLPRAPARQSGRALCWVLIDSRYLLLITQNIFVTLSNGCQSAVQLLKL